MVFDVMTPLHPSSVRTLADLFAYQCRQRSNQLAYAFVRDTLEPEHQLTYGELEYKVRSLADDLARKTSPDARVLLLYPPGIDVVCAFWACICAGLVPVPAPAPDPIRRKRTLPHLRAIADDARVSVVLTTSGVQSLAKEDLFDGQSPVIWIVTDQPLAGGDDGSISHPGASEIAYLQYTSGSTVAPRGVMISHGNVLAQCDGIVQSMGVTDQSRSLCWLPYFHDYGLVHGVIAPFYAGIPAYLMSPLTFLRRPLRWLEAIGRYGITHSGAPNFGFESCAEAIEKRADWTCNLQRWAVASCGAEPIHAQTIERFCRAFAPHGFERRAFMPAYGLAEATLVVSNSPYGLEPAIKRVSPQALEAHRVEVLDSAGDGSRTLVGCGYPLPGFSVAIVDPATCEECPAGVVGEIWVAGPSVALGYWERSDMTRATFGQHLIGNDKGDYLRTGDLGFLDEGQLFIAGRLKDLIILNGRNLYPHDLEAAVQDAHPALSGGGRVTFSIELEQAERLVCVHEFDREFDGNYEEIATAIRVALAEQCDVQVWTVALVRSGVVPKTSSGKVQRQACKQAFITQTLAMVWTSSLPLERATRMTVPTAPRDQIEQALIEIWTQVLGPGAPGVHDNFFELGGHSLLATQVLSRIREIFQMELPLRAIFETPTIANLAEHIRSARQNRRESILLPPIVPVSRETPLPLSNSQQRMWVLYKLAPDETAYNMSFASRQLGVLNKEALSQTINVLSRRHESFRTVFRMTGDGPVQVIRPWQSPQYSEVDVSQLPLSDRQAEAKRLAQEEARRPFDLETGPVGRFLLIRLSQEEHIFVVSLHHIVGDQWSFGVLGRDFRNWYNALSQGRFTQEEALPIQYADFAVWQRRCLTDETLRPQLDYWKRQLTGLPILSLPTVRPRPSTQTYAGSYCTLDLSDELIEELKHFSAQHRVTSYMTLLACFLLLLSRYTGQTDIAVGSPVANRTHQTVENLVGTFVNTLVLRTDLSADMTLIELLGRVREISLGAYEHQDFPFEKLLEVLQTERDPSYPPIVQVLFNVANVPIGDLNLQGLSWEPFEIDVGASQFDLGMTIEAEVAKKIYLIFNTNLFDREFAERMIRHFLELLENAMRHPTAHFSVLSMLTQAERNQLLDTWNLTASSYPHSQCFPDLFEEQVERTPEAIAVSMNGRVLTYRELNARANQLTRYLRRSGMPASARVGVLLDRSPEMVIALMAVLKSGGSYVPLDPEYPRDRLRFMAEDAAVGIVLTSESLSNRFESPSCRMLCLDREEKKIAEEVEQNPPRTATAGDLAYIIYTSGSTGQPKGVEIPHRALVNFLCAMRKEPGCTAQDVMVSVTTLSFDIAGLELYVPLLVGGRVEIASRADAIDGRKLRSLYEAVQPTIMQATPATWRMLIDAGWLGSDRLTVLCGGEALSPDLAAGLLDRSAALWNMYGPTETTIWSTIERIERADQEITIGRPIANTETYILDRFLQPVPVGVSGELYIGGHGLARGYCRRPELTTERFVSHPFSTEPQAKLYRTGDAARYRPDGRIVHLGRLDHQVKIRGFRVELGEIESVLSRHPAVRQVVVTAREDQRGLKQLAAYLVCVEGQAPSSTELRSFVRTTLPEYMIPSFFVFLEAMPLTANNKINVKALPGPDPSLFAGSVHVWARDRMEIQLTALWQQVLEIPMIGIHDNFFDLGGHSLKAAQLFFLLEQVYGRQLPLATLFQAPTIAQLAGVLSHEQWEPPWRSLVAIQPTGKATPLFMVPGVGGNVLIFARLTKLLGLEQPVFGLQARGLDGNEQPFTSVPEMAAHYVDEIRRVRPQGPYRIAGLCTGGLIAYEMAQQLVRCGETVQLAMIETWHPSSYHRYKRSGLATLWRSAFIARKTWINLAALFRLPVSEWAGFFKNKLPKVGTLLYGTSMEISRETDFVIERLTQATLMAMANYEVREYPGRFLNLIASNRPLAADTVDTRLEWDRLARDGADTYHITAKDAGLMLQPPHIEELVEYLKRFFPLDGEEADIRFAESRPVVKK